MMDLDEMLALLPDNTTGQIDAVHLRDIVTDLYRAATAAHQAYSYRWQNSGTPSSGKVTMDVPWSLTAATLLLSETTDDSLSPPFTLLDTAVAARIWVYDAIGSEYVADRAGVSVDQGTYRSIPITPVSVAGAQPGNNAQLTVTLLMVRS